MTTGFKCFKTKTYWVISTLQKFLLICNVQSQIFVRSCTTNWKKSSMGRKWILTRVHRGRQDGEGEVCKRRRGVGGVQLPSVSKIKKGRKCYNVPRNTDCTSTQYWMTMMRSPLDCFDPGTGRKILQSDRRNFLTNALHIFIHSKTTLY